MKAICEYCEQPFEAKRSTAKYCSDAHKLAAHRERKSALDTTAMYKQIRQISALLGDKDTAYDAAIAITNLQRTLEYVLPSKTRWWRCDCCGKSIMKFIPTRGDCPCGDGKWYLAVN